jgi:hypothetical protein
MRHITVVILSILSFGVVTHGQQSVPQRKYVVVPSKVMLLLTASQPDCPLKFEDAQLLISANKDGAWGASYKLRNAGTKPIQNISVVMWTSDGSGGTLDSPRGNDKTPIMPGETVSGGTEEVIPLTDELRAKLQLEEPMKAVVVLLVEKIKFADGSVYNNEGVSQALLGYFNNLENRGYRDSPKKGKSQ